MGVVNVTPDSFSDGGLYAGVEKAVSHGLSLVDEGADIIDVGGESTRPGAQPVPLLEESARVVPVVKALLERASKTFAVSVDTYKAEVADAALWAGAEIINDISGGRLEPELLNVVAKRHAIVILGHSRATPEHMREHASYRDVVAEVTTELKERIDAALAAGITRSHIWIDPGLGFAKRADHNIELLRRLDSLSAFNCALVVGASRKSFLRELTGVEPPRERDMGTAAAHVAAVLRGANVVRVHEIAGQRDAMRVADALKPHRVGGAR
jgi:dihydropteroate synthase